MEFGGRLPPPPRLRRTSCGLTASLRIYPLDVGSGLSVQNIAMTAAASLV
jgi:hypothetical protein